MKASSLPNLNRETTSVPNFFISFQDPYHHDGTTLNKRPNIDHSEDTEASETSPPFKDILSPFVFNEMNEDYNCSIDEFFPDLPRWPSSPNRSDTIVSVGSNQFSGDSVAGRLLVKTRSNSWWDKCNYPDFPEDEFRRAFRMSKTTFDFICDELDQILTEGDPLLHVALPVRQRVAVCIWCLATGEPLGLVSKRFELGISVCHTLVLEVCSAINTVLLDKYLIWPDKEKMEVVKRDFELVSDIPNVVGSMYTTHVPIMEPMVNGLAYFSKRHTERNQKASYSVKVQGVVDSNGVFTDVSIGWPGSMSDDEILENSAFSHQAKNGLLKSVWIVENSGYPLMDWVLVPYAEEHLTWTRYLLNNKVGKVQRVATEAFLRLKGRWCCLQKITEVKAPDLPMVVNACCVLHNICEMRNEAMDPSETRFDLFDDEISPQNGVISPQNGVSSVAAMQARDQIAHHLLHLFEASSIENAKYPTNNPENYPESENSGLDKHPK